MSSLDKDIKSRTASGRTDSPKKGRPPAVHRDKKDPHAALRAPIRAPRYSAPRRLTGQQLKNPLLRMAFSRLSRISDLRGQYLRDLDTIHGGRRTRSEKYDALAKAAEQLLLRLDLAGYVYRRIEKVRLDEKDEAGLNLVRTRVLVRFTEKFFADLGVRYLWYRAKKAAIKRRERELHQVSGLRAARQEKASLEEFRRQQSRSNWEKSEARKAAHVHGGSVVMTPSRGSGRGVKPALEPDKSSGGLGESMARLLRNVQVKKDIPQN